MTSRQSGHPRVFISYSHDSEEHEKRVLRLSQKLRQDGIDAWIDLFSPWPEEGWPRWMEKQIVKSDFVLLVCTSTYYRRVMGKEENINTGRGVCYEANLIYNELYDKKCKTNKYHPILFHDGNEEHVPLPLKGHNIFADVEFEKGYENLYRCLTNQKRYEPSELGELKKLSPADPLPVYHHHHVPGELIQPPSLYYVPREEDRLTEFVKIQRQMLIITAPRQMGKSSLLSSYVRKCETAQKTAILLDLSAFNVQECSSYECFLTTIARLLIEKLAVKSHQKHCITSQYDFYVFFQKKIVPCAKCPRVIALDIPLKILRLPYSSEFFTLLNSLNNNKYKNLQFALAISTEPYLLIKGDHQAFAFDRYVIQLEAFDLENVVELSRKYRLKESDAMTVWKLLDGHPFLTQMAYQRIAIDNISSRFLFDEAAHDRGPFAKPLRSLYTQLLRYPETRQAIEQVKQGFALDDNLYHPLYYLGLVKKRTHAEDRIEPANLLYARYFFGKESV